MRAVQLSQGPREALQIKALLFDMDGLLVDSEPLWYEVERAFVLDRCGGAWTHEHARACVGRGVPSTLAMMSEAFGFAVDVGPDALVIVESFIGRTGDLALKPGSLEILAAARAKSLPLALASSSSHRLIAAVLDRFSLAPMFGAIVSGESVPRPKPAPDIFLRAASELGVAPSSCAVLEDSLAGATAGRAAGMTVVAIPEGSPEGRGFEAVADAVLPDLHAAITWLGLR
jgi:HAD superfamily hydrolase (TIGR01509 family)